MCDAGAPSEQVAVLPLIEADWAEVRAVYAEGITSGHATFETGPPATWDAFDEGRAADHRLVAKSATGELLGWAAVTPTSSRPVYSGVLEHSVYVAAAARGRGVGTLLLAELIASTEDAGAWMLQASVFPENTASTALHASAGFRQVGVRRQIALMTHGPMAGVWRDTVLIERRSTLVGR